MRVLADRASITSFPNLNSMTEPPQQATNPCEVLLSLFKKKPKDVTTAILERKKAPNRLIVGASREDFHPHARSR